ncbi:MAG TPA: DUF1993 domain-containing protein [Xanthomonadales bacterium]|nr:DUF1993 domain-containing protein [Xanthomonadales bacterium]
MTISLYDASVASYMQIVPAVSALLDKAAEHFPAQGMDLGQIVDARLHEGMLPFRFQVVSVVHHSIGTIKAMDSGIFSPPKYDASLDFENLRAVLATATAELAALSADEVNLKSGKALAFVMGDLNLPFTTENFVLSFSLPNFYFHAATTYDILRHLGLPLGKRDFMGRLRITRQPKA